MSESYRIGLDVGGTKVLGAVFDGERNIVHRLKKKSVLRLAEYYPKKTIETLIQTELFNELA